MESYTGVVIFLLAIIILILIIVIIVQIIYVYIPIRDISRDAKTIVSATQEIIPKLDTALEGADRTEQKIDTLITSVNSIEPVAVQTLNTVDSFIVRAESAICNSVLGSTLCTNGQLNPPSNNGNMTNM